MGRMKKRGPLAVSGNPLFLLMLAVVISGLFISGLGIASLSHQKESRKLDLLEQWRDRLKRIQSGMEEESNRSLHEAFVFFRKNLPDFSDPLQIQKALKTLLDRHPVVQYPFIISPHSGFLFPFSKKMTGLPALFPSFRFSAPATRNSYEEGEDRELRKRDWQGAIRSFLSGLDLSANPAEEAQFMLALGRCYFKWGKYPQTTEYLQDILERIPSALEEISGLRLNTLHLLALSARRMGRADEAANRYLQLYESILAVQAIGKAEGLDFFKNEALDYLSRHVAEGNPLDRRFLEARNRDPFERESSVDFSLRWALFGLPSVEETAIPGQMETLDRQRLRQIQEFYLSGDEKEDFYSKVRQTFETRSEPGDLPKTSDTQAAHWDDGSGAVFTRIDGDVPDLPPLYFGFHLSPDYLDQKIFVPVRSEIWHDTVPDLRLSNRNNSAGSAGEKLTLMKLPLEDPFANRELAVVVPSEEYVLKRIGRDLTLNYLLILFLVITLLAGLFLAFRYLYREMELVGLKSRFLDAASHTLKTPLARIRILSEQLQLNWVKGEKEKKTYLGKIIAETDGMNEMIGNLLDLSRIESDAKHYDFRMNSLAETIEKTLESITPLLDRLKFQRRISIDPALPVFEFDAAAVRLILLNLLQNAVKYSRDEKWISLKALKEADEVCLEVEDHGIGIHENEWKRIFEKFYRIEDEITQSAEGSGLGLYLVRHAVDAHGGKITVKGEPGKGSIFAIRLPIKTKKGGK